jgi:hypothetical protein
MAATAVTWLWAKGDCSLAMLAAPMLCMMWYATRQRARRRARGSGEA